MAVKSLEMARDRWREMITPASSDPTKPSEDAAVKSDRNKQEGVNIVLLRPEQELYFDMSLGSIYESCGKDDIAVSYYMKAREIKLPYNHPDRAFPYCGLGSVLYHIDEPAWALRSYLQAR